MSSSRISVWVALVALWCCGLALAAGPAEYRIAVDPTNSCSLFIMKGDQQAARIGIVGWGPSWGWTSISSTKKAEGGVLDFTSPVKLGDKTVQLAMNAKMADARTLQVKYTLEAAQDTPLTQVVVTLGAAAGSDGKATLTDAAGKQATTKVPAGIGGYGTVAEIALSSSILTSPVQLQLEPATAVSSDGDLRIGLASETLKAGQKIVSLTLKFPGDAKFLASKADIEELAPVVAGADWFAYQGNWDSSASVIGMENWLDKPAGKHGGVRMVKDEFQFEDGTAVKFWGVDLSYGLSAPTKADAEFTAARFAKYGVNAVRMHKFTGPGWEGIGDENDATKMKPEGMDRLDYFASQLTQKGVYYGWSHSFGFKVRPGNRDQIAGYDELMKKGGTTYAVINWAEDCQDLMIGMVVNLLKHKNPYTGKTYAEDPALSYIELQNEDDIFFYTTETAYKDYPTYRTLLEKRYAEWLTAKYGTQEKLAAAWSGALKPAEQLNNASVAIIPNPWNMGSGSLPNLRGGARQRMLDNAAFLFDTQNRFYSKFVKAIRDTGYKGPLCGSPWQAPDMLPHYYNLKADYLVGYIDRHDYFGGALIDTMLHTAGGGYLSAGLQQVADRPFGLSEWIHVYPSLYSAEGPLLIAAYGMGLQGWDSSYEFQSTSVRPGNSVGNEPWGVWNADAPTQIGQFPTISRMVLRGDVKQGPTISVRRVGPQDLASGSFNFSDRVQQQGDVKTFTGSVPASALAAGRSVVEFVDATTPSTFPDMAKYRNGNVTTSATGQLAWDEKQGVVTVNTPGTQGYVGFAAGQKLALGDVTIQPQTPYAMILVSATDKQSTLKDAKTAIISVVARNANKGMRVLSVDGKTIVDNGAAPIMLEPVKATISFTGRQVSTVRILDHNGKATPRMLPAQSGQLSIDGVADKAIYYEVTFQ